MATLVDPRLTGAALPARLVSPLPVAMPTVVQRQRMLRRRVRAGVLRDWLAASAVGGFALALAAVTLFSLIAH